MTKLLLILFFLFSYFSSFSIGMSGERENKDISLAVVTGGNTYKIKRGLPVITNIASSTEVLVQAPATPGPISGEVNVCALTTMSYSVTAVANAESYNWTVPSGWTITAGQGTTAISLKTNNTSGNISVTAANGFGVSAARTLVVEVSGGQPSEPGPIRGSTNICPGNPETYSITPVAGATGYTWSVPAGWTIILGQGSSSIDVIPGIDGEISVVATNSCGISLKKTLNSTYFPLFMIEQTANLVIVVCAGNSPSTLVGDIPAGGTDSYTFLWESSTQGNRVGFMPAMGVNNAKNYSPGIITQTTWFRRIVRSGCESMYSNEVEIFVTPTVSNNTIFSQTKSVCAGWAANELTGSLPTGGNRVYTYQWETSVLGSTAGFVPASGYNTNINYFPGPIKQTTWFRRTVASGCLAETSNVIQIEVSPQPPAPKTTANAPEVGGTLQLIASNSMAGLTYTWEGPNNFTANEQNPVITNVTEAMAGYYFVRAHFNLNDCFSYDSLLVTIKPAPVVTPPTITTGLSPLVVCAGATMAVPFTTTGTFQTGNVFSVQIMDLFNPQEWKSIGTGPNSPIVATIPVGMDDKHYRLRVIALAPAIIGSESNEHLYINPDITKSQPGAITGNATPCPGTKNLHYSINWVIKANSYYWTVPPGWTIQSGQDTTVLTVTSGATAGLISVVGLNPCGSSLVRTLAVNPVTVEVPNLKGESRCGAGSVKLTATGAPAGSIYQWYTTATGSTPIQNGATFITPALTATTTYYVSIILPGGCESARTAVTATINPAPLINAGSDEIICLTSSGIALTSFSPAGGTWSGLGVSADGLFNPKAAGLGTHSITYTATQNGCSASATKKVTVTETPLVTLAPFINPVCVTNSQYVLTGGFPVGGTYSGRSVRNGIFNAAMVGVGTDSVFYTYAKPGGCAVRVGQLIRITADCPASDDLEANLGLAPNPASTDLYVSLPLPAKTDLILRLLDAKGLVVYEQRYAQVSGEFREKLDIRFNAKGIYTLHLILDFAMVAKRIVIE